MGWILVKGPPRDPLTLTLSPGGGEGIIGCVEREP